MRKLLLRGQARTMRVAAETSRMNPPPPPRFSGWQLRIWLHRGAL